MQNPGSPTDDLTLERYDRKKLAVEVAAVEPSITMTKAAHAKPGLIQPGALIVNPEAAAFWQSCFGNRDKVSWAHLVGALKVEFPALVKGASREALASLRAEVDFDEDGQICQLEFNVFTKASGLRSAVEAALGSSLSTELSQAGATSSAATAPESHPTPAVLATNSAEQSDREELASCLQGGLLVLSSEPGDPLPVTNTVLFLGAQNSSSAQLELERELKQAESKFKSRFGERDWQTAATFVYNYCSRFNAAMEAVQRLTPSILHFACQRGGLELFQQTASSAVLSDVIKNLNRSRGVAVRLVVINACSSSFIARTLARDAGVDFVIGHVGPVADAKAMLFSEHLYLSLGQLIDLKTSFQLARSASGDDKYVLYAMRDPGSFRFQHPCIAEVSDARQRRENAEAAAQGLRRNAARIAMANLEGRAYEASSDSTACKWCRRPLAAHFGSEHACVPSESSVQWFSPTVFLAVDLPSTCQGEVEGCGMRLRTGHIAGAVLLFLFFVAGIVGIEKLGQGQVVGLLYLFPGLLAGFVIWRSWRRRRRQAVELAALRVATESEVMRSLRL